MKLAVPGILIAIKSQMVIYYSLIMILTIITLFLFKMERYSYGHQTFHKFIKYHFFYGNSSVKGVVSSVLKASKPKCVRK